MSAVRRSLMNAKGGSNLLNYLCFTALEEGTFTLTIPANVPVSSISYIEYTINEGKSWIKTNNVDSTAITITTPTIRTDKKVYWRGSGKTLAASGSVYSNFSSTCKFTASGNFHSLYKIDDFNEYTQFGEQFAVTGTFKNSLIVECHIDFGVNKRNNTFISAFENCKELLICTSRLKGEGGVYSHQKMFKGCNKLIVPPDLSTMSPTSSSYNFGESFNGCIALTSIELPFISKLGGNFYNSTFYNCTNLSYIKMLSTDISASNCLKNWVYGVAATGIFVKNINAIWDVRGVNGVPTDWTIIYYDRAEGKYYTSQDKSQECDDHGNPILN